MKRARPIAAWRDPRRADRRRTAEIIPPEGVPLHFEIAGLGARLAAQLIDILITVGMALAIVVLLLLVRLNAGAGLFAVAALLFFLVRVPYYVATELLLERADRRQAHLRSPRDLGQWAESRRCTRSSPAIS